MRLHFILSLLLVGLVGVGCKPTPTPPTPQASGADTSATSLDWHGAYEGVVPWVGGMEYRTRLTLRPDHSYTLELTQLGEGQGTAVTEGSFAWASDGSTVFLNDVTEGPNRYFLGEGFMAQLDLEGQRITGELAERYVLKKVPTSPLAGTRWQLVELNAQAVTADPPLTLQFSEQADTVSGHSGCNTFRGGVAWQDHERWALGPLASTRMACPDMGLELRYLEALQESDSYHLEGDTLKLFRARMAPLAVFRRQP